MFRLLQVQNFSCSKLRTLNSFVKHDKLTQVCSHCRDVHARPDTSRRHIHNSTRDSQLAEKKEAVEVKKKKRTVLKRRTNVEIIKELSQSPRKAEPKDAKAEVLGTIPKYNSMSSTLKMLGVETGAEVTLAEAEAPKKSVKVCEASKAEEKRLLAELTAHEEKASRAESATKTLLAYLEVAVHCGFLNKANTVLSSYYTRSCTSKSKMGELNNVELFNIILYGYASKGNFGRVFEVMETMKYSKIEPDIDSFAACFECVGRMDPTYLTSLQLTEWHKLMYLRKLSMQSLFINKQLSEDQRNFILTSCKRIDPDFIVENVTEDLNYQCPLLQDFDPSKIVNPKWLSNVMTANSLKAKAGEQIELEKKGTLSVKSIERSSQPPETTQLYRTELKKAEDGWRAVLRESFWRNITELKISHQGYDSYISIYPFLKCLPVEQYVDIMMKEIRKLAEGSESYSPSMRLLFQDAGSEVETRYHVHCNLKSGLVEKIGKIYDKYCDWYANGENETISNTRVHWQQLVEKSEEGPSIHTEYQPWPPNVVMSIGKFLFNIILRDVKINANVLKPDVTDSLMLPGFYPIYRVSGKHITEEVKPHPVLAKLYRGAAPEILNFSASDVPMISPPIPWSSIKQGGHVITKTDIIRLPPQAVSQWKRMEDTPVQQLYPAFDSLNQLGAIPWKINEPMLDVAMQVFVSGGNSKLDVPEPPSSLAGPDQLSHEMSKAERVDIYKQRLSIRRQKAEMYSLWCDALYKLSLANHYRKEVFWFPHNMDFRGRVYPCPPHLNHLGSDLARSILCFAKGEKLGKHGLDWLKIHVINLTGLKKRDSKVERLRYANEILPDILDSAENPLYGRKWWVESDEPWQTLAGCMEIAKALKAPDPEEFVSNFPVHQDGSCNGLQHYAALGRDLAGAESVNLAPAETPQDVYSRVAALVERERSQDASKGLKIARVLDGYVKRKTIKQTVMTTVYGVTRYGARLQIAKQLKDLENFPPDMVWGASQYLVQKTFESLREMFSSAREIQDWFTECAHIISKFQRQKMEWVTPLGLPIVQPYIKSPRDFFNAKGESNNITEKFVVDTFGIPNVVKQKNAFPPNFIHSLDSSHMMLTALNCEKQGITFVSVHDCFWTHPSTVDVMNRTCREQFVALHNEPILEELSKSLVHKFGDNEEYDRVLTRVPHKGSFDLHQVLDSIYFFS